LSQTRIRRAGPWPGWIRPGLRIPVPGSRRLHHRPKHPDRGRRLSRHVL